MESLLYIHITLQYKYAGFYLRTDASTPKLTVHHGSFDRATLCFYQFLDE